MECPICKGGFHSSDSAICIVKHISDKTITESRKRGHYYHRHCMDAWKKNQLDRDKCICCPLDREPIKCMYTVGPYMLFGMDLKDYTDFYDLIETGKNTIRLSDRVLEKIVNINEMDHKGRTLIYCAVQRGMDTLTKRLMRKGADPTICDSNGFSPLMLTICNNNYELFSHFIRNKKVIDTISKADKFGITPLQHACIYCRYKMLSDILLTENIDKRQVSYAIEMYRGKLEKDTMYGKDSLKILYSYLKTSF